MRLEPAEIVVAPGTTVTAMLKVERNGHDDLITFSVDNLPHGVIVDNIGLNGVLMPKGESERQIFITADAWVPRDQPPGLRHRKPGRRSMLAAGDGPRATSEPTGRRGEVVRSRCRSMDRQGFLSARCLAC